VPSQIWSRWTCESSVAHDLRSRALDCPARFCFFICWTSLNRVLHRQMLSAARAFVDLTRLSEESVIPQLSLINDLASLTHRSCSSRQKTRLYDDGECERLCEPIRERLYLGALTNAKLIAEVYGSVDLRGAIDALGLHDRAVDIWKPILAVTKVFGSDEMVRQLSELAREMSPDPDRQEEMRQLEIVRGLRTVAGDGGSIVGTTQRVTEMLKTVAGIECPDLHAVLTGWAFTEKSMRLQGIETPRKAWDLTDADLTQVEERLR